MSLGPSYNSNLVAMDTCTPLAFQSGSLQYSPVVMTVQCGMQIFFLTQPQYVYPSYPTPMVLCSSPPIQIQCHSPVQTQLFSQPPSPDHQPIQITNQTFAFQSPKYKCHSPVQTQLFSQPPSPDHQPIQNTNQTFAFQSPSQPCFTPGQIFQPAENCGPASRSHSAESAPSFLRFYAFDEIQEDFMKKFSTHDLKSELDLAMKRALNRNDLNFDVYIFRSPEKKEKKVTIEWRVDSEYLALVQPQVQRKDFEARLTCELAKIDGGSFNVYLSRGKQLTIIRQGWSVLRALQHSLVSKHGRLQQLLATPEEDWFVEEVYQKLFKVSEDARGNALRGSTVLGVRFKLLQEFFNMTNFIEGVQQHFGTFRRSTMIVSSKKGTQKKGWSIYLDVGTQITNEDCQKLAEQFGLPLKRVFVAQEKKT